MAMIACLDHILTSIMWTITSSKQDLFLNPSLLFQSITHVRGSLALVWQRTPSILTPCGMQFILLFCLLIRYVTCTDHANTPFREFINNDDKHHQNLFNKFKKTHMKDYGTKEEHAKRYVIKLMRCIKSTMSLGKCLMSQLYCQGVHISTKHSIYSLQE